MSQCKGLTLKGSRCKRICKNGEYCYNHDAQATTPECCVCLESTKCETLDCKHTICNECAYKWSLSKKFKAECPMCRAPMDHQGYYQHLAIERRDAIKVFIYSFNGMTQQDYSSLGIEIPFDTLITQSESEFILRQILTNNDLIYSKISRVKEIQVLSTDCKCTDCIGYKNGTNNKVCYFKRPSSMEEGYPELIQMIESVMRRINLF
jgi:hypothetical protein